MDKDLAWIVAGAATVAGRELGDLVPLLKEHCDPEAYDKLVDAIGSAIYETAEVRERVFELSPGLREEFEARLHKFGRQY
jgi:hypothetical protein